MAKRSIKFPSLSLSPKGSHKQIRRPPPNTPNIWLPKQHPSYIQPLGKCPKCPYIKYTDWIALWGKTVQLLLITLDGPGAIMMSFPLDTSFIMVPCVLRFVVTWHTGMARRFCGPNQETLHPWFWLLRPKQWNPPPVILRLKSPSSLANLRKASLTPSFEAKPVKTSCTPVHNVTNSLFFRTNRSNHQC